eukprot:NODE_828_length_3870_cov_0.198091.p3 type:complete len:102 gc:universal NODE_828_length_3870_cov_0.198091:532-227(-)
MMSRWVFGTMMILAIALLFAIPNMNIPQDNNRQNLRTELIGIKAYYPTAYSHILPCVSKLWSQEIVRHSNNNKGQQTNGQNVIGRLNFIEKIIMEPDSQAS